MLTNKGRRLDETENTSKDANEHLAGYAIKVNYDFAMTIAEWMQEAWGQGRSGVSAWPEQQFINPSADLNVNQECIRSSTSATSIVDQFKIKK